LKRQINERAVQGDMLTDQTHQGTVSTVGSISFYAQFFMEPVFYGISFLCGLAEAAES